MNSEIFNSEFESIFQKDFNLFEGQHINLGNTIITGTQGMLGNGIARYLVRLKDEKLFSYDTLFLYSRFWTKESKELWNSRQDVELMQYSELKSSEAKISTVFHCASPSNITKIESYAQLFDANVKLLHEILNLSPTTALFVSSSEVYASPLNPKEEDELGNFSGEAKRNWYPRAKIIGELEIQEFSRRKDNSGIVIRLFHTFGPGLQESDGRSFSDIIWEATRFNRITLKSEGDQIRTFSYLEDSVRAILKIIFHKQLGFQVFNVGSKDKFSILEFAQVVSSITGAPIHYDLDPGFLHSPRDRIYPNIEKLNLLGWNSEWETRDGIENTIRWVYDCMS
jgi:dTDP-glucose 4,6-dehydratase/UDP-glucuronate decarboxylase